MAFVFSAGRLAQLDRYAVPERPLPAGLTLDNQSWSYKELYRTQPQLRTVVNFLGRNIAQLGLHLYKRVSDTDRERINDHPMAKLFDKPSPWTTPYRLINDLVCDLAIYDRAFWLKTSAGGTDALVRLDPIKVLLRGNNPFVAEGYRYMGGAASGYTDFPTDQVVHFHGYNPGDHRDGCSPIDALRTLLLVELHAAQYRDQLWRNGARAAGYIRRPLEAAQWSRDARNRFRQQWQAQYSGDSPLAGGTPILEDGMEWTSASVTPEQAQYLESRKLTREEVAAAYHIPPSMLGILDHANFANIREQHKILYQDTVGPWLMMISQEIDLQLKPDFSGTEKLYTEFNLDEKLRGAFEDQATQLQIAVGGPYMTRNEGRSRLNLPTVDGGDELITPLNVLVGDDPQANPRDSAPPPNVPTDQLPADNGAPRALPAAAARRPSGKARVDAAYVELAAKVLQRYFARQASSVSAALNARSRHRLTSVSAIYDQGRWTRDLAAELYGLSGRIVAGAAKSALRELGLDPTRFDETRTLGWLREHSERVAKRLEEGTAGALAKALKAEDSVAAVAALFASYTAGRAREVAETEVTALSGFGTTEAVKTSGKTATKTWRTTSSHPRSAHAAINGETVPIEGKFSNGASFPGDIALPPEQRVGCKCEIDVKIS